MSVNSIFREEYTKNNGWTVRVDFLPAGGDLAAYNTRSITPISEVFEGVGTQKESFDKLPAGLADAGSCTFKINYSTAPTDMSDALDSQYQDVTFSAGGFTYNGSVPNLFVVWSDRGTSAAAPTAFTFSAHGTGYTTDTDVETGALTGTGQGLRVNIVASAIAEARSVILNTPGSTYSVASAVSTTAATGTGTGAKVDIGAVDGGGAITSVSLSSGQGGSGYAIGDLLAVAGGDGTARVEVDDVTVGGVISALTLVGGSGYAIGDTVQVIAGNADCIITITAISTPTWTPEFIGSHRITPETKETVTERGIIIECEAIALAKCVLELPIDKEMLLNQAANISPSLTAAMVESNFYNEFGRQVSIARYDIFRCQLPSGQANFVKLERVMTALQNILSYYASLLTGQPASISIMACDVLGACRVIFAKQDLNTIGVIGARGSGLDWSDIYIVANVTSSSLASNGTRAVYNTSEALGGLFSDDEDSITADAKNYWDLLKQLVEQLWLKGNCLTSFHSASDTLRFSWSFHTPYESATSASTVAYDDTQEEEPFWLRNSDRLGKAKLHQRTYGAGLETFETYNQGKSDEGYEITALFSADWLLAEDAQKVYVETSNRSKVVSQWISTRDQFNLRGLFYYESGVMWAVCPRITLYRDPVTAYITDADFDSAEHLTTAEDWIQAIQAAQNAEVNFKKVAASYLYLFGTTSNQTRYEHKTFLRDFLLPYKLGDAMNITPHSERTAQISTKGYLIELQIDWSADDSGDFVQVAYLTRGKELE